MVAILAEAVVERLPDERLQALYVAPPRGEQAVLRRARFDHIAGEG